MSFPRSMDTHAAEGQKAIAAAAERNKEPILAVLREFLGSAAAGGLFLEVASGTGQHVAHLAAGLPQLTFQPTEYEADSFVSIRAWTHELLNVRPPLLLDASRPASWQVAAGTCRAVFAANLTHISPWAATEGLVAGAGRVLAHGGELFIYGPFSVDGKPTTESNAAFDAALRQRNPQWGYRDVADIARLAAAAGLAAVERREMPANNLLLVFRKE
ncbi:hypothetical protein ABPG77_002153 [Micractinium sp. CCAP 211/92]